MIAAPRQQRSSRARAALSLALCLAASAATTPAHAVPFELKGKLTFEPPDGWTEIAPAAARELMRKNLGAPARSDAPAKEEHSPLALFLGPDSGMFRGTLNVREVPGGPPLDERAIAEYKESAQRAFGPTVKAAIGKVELIEIGGKKALRAELEYELPGHSLKTVQGVFRTIDKTVLATYTVTAAQFAAESPRIEASLRSFRFDEPWHAFITRRPIVLYSIVGVVGGAFLVLVFRRKRALSG